MDWGLEILTGDCRDILPTLEAGSVQCCVTSPPYWGLRDYGTAEWEGGSVWCEHKAGSDYGTKNDTNNGAIRGASWPVVNRVTPCLTRLPAQARLARWRLSLGAGRS
jgi:hypothetical protein